MRERGATTILVTSPEARDGKTTVAANLAAAYAQAGKRVLVISCDLRRPAIHEMFGVAERPGLTDVLRSMDHDGETLKVAPYLKPCSILRVAVLPGGTATDRPTELLGSAAMRRLVERLKQITDVVILDCAPLVVAGDVVPLLPMADGVVVVARAGKTRRRGRREQRNAPRTTRAGGGRCGAERRARVLDPPGEAAACTGRRGRRGRPSKHDPQRQVDEDWIPTPAVEPPVVDQRAPVTSAPASIDEPQVTSEPDDVVTIPDLPETSNEPVVERSPGIRASTSGGLQALREELAALREELVSVQVDPDQPSAEPTRSLPIGFRPGSDRSG